LSIAYKTHQSSHSIIDLLALARVPKPKKGISGDSVPTTNSVDLLRVLAIACEVTTDDLPDFVHQLAEGHGGLSLEYMYHRDALRSGTSYQNSGHIHLKDNCQVGTPSPLSSPTPISFSLLLLPRPFSR
jgi:hypothetical protein